MIERTCTVCNKTFSYEPHRTGRRRSVCSKECKNKRALQFKREHMKSLKEITPRKEPRVSSCVICSKNFSYMCYGRPRITCSKKCRDIQKRTYYQTRYPDRYTKLTTDQLNKNNEKRAIQSKRNLEMLELIKNGSSFREVGRIYDLSGEAVRQIINSLTTNNPSNSSDPSNPSLNLPLEVPLLEGDLTGQTVYGFKVISLVRRYGSKNYPRYGMWKVVCPGCKKEVELTNFQMTHRVTCGCKRPPEMRIDPKRDPRKKGEIPDTLLTPIEPQGNRKWKFQCRCGGTIIADLQNVRHKKSPRNCGCIPIRRGTPSHKNHNTSTTN